MAATFTVLVVYFTPFLEGVTDLKNGLYLTAYGSCARAYGMSAPVNDCTARVVGPSEAESPTAGATPPELCCRECR